MLYAVKIWGKELKCDICSDNQGLKVLLKQNLKVK